MMRVHLIQGGIVINTVMAESVAFAQELYPDCICIEATIGGIGWTWDGAQLSEPVPVVPEPVVPSAVTSLQGLKALDAAGMAEAYTAWANAPERTFLEKAFIDKAQTWQRDNEVIAAARVALGLTDQQIDDLFILAATL